MALTGKSLDAATATGPGAVIAFDVPKVNVSMEVVVTGAPSACTVLFEGSIDGVTFFTLGQTSGSSRATSTNIAVVAVRANLDVLTGGTTPTVTASIAAA